jgi:hypothetical protein
LVLACLAPGSPPALRRERPRKSLIKLGKAGGASACEHQRGDPEPRRRLWTNHNCEGKILLLL